MTNHTQLLTSPAGSPVEHATHGMPAGQLFQTNPSALLDHRTRSRTVVADTASPGRYLSIEDGEQTRLIPLTRPIIHIGRGLTSDVRIEDTQVSRHHAIIAQRGEGTRVLDDRSANGTFVNGRQVTVAQLSDGDVLRLGSAVLRFVVVTSPVKGAAVRRRIPLPVRAPGRLATGTPS
jgi:hypothetical protein